MNPTILIVDDTPKNLQVLGNILKSENYSIEFAMNGKSVLRWIEKRAFDLILMDVMMPEMDGFEVCEIIRDKYKIIDIPIIFLTAKKDKESILKGFEVGGQDYISKPFDSKELLVRVKTQIELKKSKEALKELNESLEQKVKARTVELEENEKKYRYALEAANDGIWDWDLDTDSIEFSEALYTMLGYKPYEFPATRAEINKRIHLDDLKGRDEIVSIPEIKSENITQIEEEYRIRTKEGIYKWLRVHGKAVEWNNENQISRYIGTHTDITLEKERNFAILDAVLKTEDRERSRISQEIHDGLQQTLTISLLNFDYAKKGIEKLDKTYKDKFNIGWNYLQKGITESRVVAHSLMPKAIVDFGLISAYESLIELIGKSSEETNFNFNHNFGTTRINNKQVENTLYRILQESLNNIIKYAKAKNVEIQLKNYDDIILLTIEDDGIGFDINAIDNNSFGIKGIKNRLEPINGFFEINSQLNKGTTIIVEIDKKVM